MNFCPPAFRRRRNGAEKRFRISTISRISKELNYKIFMAEVENIGYKRTKRGEKPMPNELYRTKDNKNDGEILVDDGVMKTALDYMRKIKWE